MYDIAALKRMFYIKGAVCEVNMNLYMIILVIINHLSVIILYLFLMICYCDVLFCYCARVQLMNLC